MKRRVVSLVVVGLTLAGNAASTVSYEEDGKALVYTVPTNETDILTKDVADILNANTVTNFYKRGAGLLTVKEDTTGYTGRFWIQAGILKSNPTITQANVSNPTLGKPGLERNGCGSVHVEPGATLAMRPREAYNESLTTDKTVYFGGAGYGGKGALMVMDGDVVSSKATALFGTELIMTSDARIYNDNRTYYMGVINGGVLDMNGHTVTFGGRDTGAGSIFSCNYNNATFKDDGLWNRVGDVIVESQFLNLSAYLAWFGHDTSTSNHTLRVKKGAELVVNNTADRPFGRLVMEEGTRIRLNECRRTVNHLATQPNRQRWAGDVLLDTPGFIAIESSTGDPRYFQFDGIVSGGGLYVGKNVQVVFREGDSSLKAGNRYDAAGRVNSFTNGIVIADGGDVTLEWQTCIPKNGGDVVMSNASFTVRGGRTFDLPPFRCHGDCKFQGFMGNGSDPGVRDQRMYFPTLQFFQHATGAFSSNLVVSALIGLPEIKPYPAAADTPYPDCFPKQDVSTAPCLVQVHTSWDIDLADVIAGDTFKTPCEMVFSSGVAINVHGLKYARGKKKKFKIAEAPKITFKGAKTVTVEDPEWTFTEEADGLYLTCETRGALMIVR